MDPLAYLAQLGGVARTGQFLSAGYSRRDIARLARVAGQPRRGLFALPNCRPEFLAALQHNARVSCASAASHYGLWLRDAPTQHHLACNHGHGSGFVRHRTLRFEGPAELPLAAVEDVVLHALGCLAPPASTAIATSAMRLLGVPLELLHAELTADRSGTARQALRQLDLRNNASTLSGFAVLRYMPEHIWFEPERVPAEIRAVLAGPRHVR